MKYEYSFQQYDKEKMVRASLRNTAISYKKAYEVANFIRGRQVDKAVALLELVLKHKIAVPYGRYNRDIAHKPGTGPGRYPETVAIEVIRLLKALKTQAQAKGLDANKLAIIHAATHRGDKRPHYGSLRTSRKNAHFEVVGKEVEQEKKLKSKGDKKP